MGTLDGIRIVEMSGLGPVPFAAMMFADMGADVVRIDAPPRNAEDPHDHEGPIWRGRGAVTLDLKSESENARARALINAADVVLEGFRPGVMERLGLGPEAFEESNPGLVFGRMTGWGQSGQLAAAAGHDINYLATGGILHYIARQGERPMPPLNLVGDYGGGGMLLVGGVLAALLERVRSGRGQVVDAAMLDGAALLMTSVLGWQGRGQWSEPPGTNMIDTGAPFYEVYTTNDGGHLAVGAIEPRFYRRLIDVLELSDVGLPDQFDRASWPETKKVFADAIARRTLSEWRAAFEGVDACVSPVLDLEQATADPHIHERQTYVRDGQFLHANPAPRFARTPSERGRDGIAESLEDVLERWKTVRAK
ncbi:putative acyl-CoA transferase/carnitine dehydratase (plasmid) [Rhodococcus opacus]|uniref:Putative acyl-CoA transferase/carnitine dehydratase n=1 Tax=Rhodococcus opacus TaxID=37919 RepID=A0A1B1KHY7_RHOOP|nr:CaiB/BaiF CoA-transferase family protein [Rhodococcus opacus]ANS32232.1 putative acyl-CoA transferase/carnitine dehydratase [Rhodococcus opacus]